MFGSPKICPMRTMPTKIHHMQNIGSTAPYRTVFWSFGHWRRKMKYCEAGFNFQKDPSMCLIEHSQKYSLWSSETWTNCYHRPLLWIIESNEPFFSRKAFDDYQQKRRHSAIWQCNELRWKVLPYKSYPILHFRISISIPTTFS